MPTTQIACTWSLRIFASTVFALALLSASPSLSAEETSAASEGDSAKPVTVVIEVKGFKFVPDSHINIWLKSANGQSMSKQLSRSNGIFDNCTDSDYKCGQARVEFKQVEAGAEYKITVCHTLRNETDCQLEPDGQPSEAGEVRSIRPQIDKSRFVFELQDRYPS